jgi:hypothetical protein
MQDDAKVLLVVTAETKRNLLCESVADGVRVPSPFALDDLDRLRPGQSRFKFVNDDFQATPLPDSQI